MGHVIEHLLPGAARSLLALLCDRLPKGAVVSAVVPDMRAIFAAYDRGEVSNDDLNARFVYSYVQPSHHLWCHDLDSLTQLFREAGFRDAEPIDPSEWEPVYWKEGDESRWQCGVRATATGSAHGQAVPDAPAASATDARSTGDGAHAPTVEEMLLERVRRLKEALKEESARAQGLEAAVLHGEPPPRHAPPRPAPPAGAAATGPGTDDGSPLRRTRRADGGQAAAAHRDPAPGAGQHHARHPPGAARHQGPAGRDVGQAGPAPDRAPVLPAVGQAPRRHRRRAGQPGQRLASYRRPHADGRPRPQHRRRRRPRPQPQIAGGAVVGDVGGAGHHPPRQPRRPAPPVPRPPDPVGRLRRGRPVGRRQPGRGPHRRPRLPDVPGGGRRGRGRLHLPGRQPRPPRPPRRPRVLGRRRAGGGGLGERVPPRPPVPARVVARHAGERQLRRPLVRHPAGPVHPGRGGGPSVGTGPAVGDAPAQPARRDPGLPRHPGAQPPPPARRLGRRAGTGRGQRPPGRAGRPGGGGAGGGAGPAAVEPARAPPGVDRDPHPPQPAHGRPLPGEPGPHRLPRLRRGGDRQRPRDRGERGLVRQASPTSTWPSTGGRSRSTTPRSTTSVRPRPAATSWSSSTTTPRSSTRVG